MSYQQFFKTAQDVKRGEAGEPKPRTSGGTPPKSKPRFEVRAPKAADATEQRLRQALRPTRKAPPPPPWKAIAALSVSLGLAGFYLASPELVEHALDRIEIRAFGPASASEGKGAAEKSSGAKDAKAKAAGDASHAEPAKGPEGKEAVSEDLSHFEKLKQRKEELDRREKELSELEEELQRQKVELDKRIQQLEDMRTQIAQVLKDRVEMDQEKVTKLVDLYSNMKPKQAADVIGTINEELAVEVLAKMKKKNAAEIMNLLPAEKARVLSEKYTGYRRNHPDPKG